MKMPNIVVLAIILIVIYIMLYIYTLATYGGEPVGEIPLWAWMILRGRG